MVVNLFSHLKVAPPCSSTSIDVKTISPDPEDFDMTWLASTSMTAAHRAKCLGTSRCDGSDMPMVAQRIEQTANTRHLVFCSNCHKPLAHFSQLWQFANGCATIGISSNHSPIC
jgi:hypothetical protein